MVQVAGLIARRILCYVKAGDVLARGQRYGFIRFGSRLDVYLPLTASIKVAIGDKVCHFPPYWLSFSHPRRPWRGPDNLEPMTCAGAAFICCPICSTAALFAGFYAIVQAMNDQFDTVSWPSSLPWCSMAWTDA